jgi:ABC-type cobalt transport system substrate-binding protein
MSLVVRKYVPQIIISAIIVAIVAFYYLYISKEVAGAFSTADKALSDWAVIITSFALIVGGIDILRFHVLRIKREGLAQAPFSTVTIALLIIMVIFGLIGWYYSYADPKAGITITTQPQFRWLYTNVYGPSDAAVYSILVFYIASASYRAFRVRNPMALLLLITAVIIMFGNTTIGGLIWPGFLSLRDWIMTVPNTAAFRPITIGAGLGTIVLGLRLLTWREVSWMGRRE